MSPYDYPEYHALIRHIRHIERTGHGSTLARLVTADWLEEHGDEHRAEFIRMQCEQAVSPSLGNTERCCQLLRQSAERWLDRVWWPEHNPDTSRTTIWYQLYMGFYHGFFFPHVRCGLDQWIAHGPDLVRRHPVRALVLTGGVPIYRTGTRWFWGPLHHPLNPHFVSGRTHSTGHRSWDAEQDARDAVNTAALLWAESDADQSGHRENNR
jgi:uncharacterized protein (TIGR02996 family)